MNQGAGAAKYLREKKIKVLKKYFNNNFVFSFIPSALHWTPREFSEENYDRSINYYCTYWTEIIQRNNN